MIILEDIIRSPQLRALAREDPLGPHVDQFVETVASVGYTPTSLHDLIYGVIQFGAFLCKRGITDLRELQVSHVNEFVATQPLRLCRGKYHYPISRGVRGAHHLLRFARAMEIIAPEPAPPPPIYAPLLDEWLGFLEQHHGLAPGSLELYHRYIKRFLEHLGPDATVSGLQRLKPDRIRDYVSLSLKGRSRSECKSVVSTLRIFLRYAWSRGYLSQDLSLAVDRVPCFKEERLPRGPRWEDALRLLDTPDRSTALGLRDYAILQIFLTYGVRGQQVSRLCLNDIQWRKSTIRFAPLKGGRPLEFPLLAPVGEALVKYLQERRPSSEKRSVFLSTHPPFAALTKSGITALVARAFERAGVPSPHHGSHSLRHAWATRLLAEGQSLKTIADLLGHRSLESTRIYAKVDFVRLRTVGLPWPEEVTK